MAQDLRSVLIDGGIVLPMDGTKTVHDPGSVLVVDGVIAAIGGVDEVAAHPAAASVPRVDAATHAVIPGLHNGHLHSGLLRGTAESLALWEWLENHIDPAHRALTPEIARAGSYMAYTEALRGGTTSVLDMWRFMEGSAEAAAAVGIRAPSPPTAPTVTTTSSPSSRTAVCWRATSSRPKAGFAPGSGSSTCSTARPTCSAGPLRSPRSSEPASTPTRPSRSGRSRSACVSTAAARSRRSTSAASSARRR